MPSVNVPSELTPDSADSEGLFQLDGMDENPPATFQSEDETDTDRMFILGTSLITEVLSHYFPF